MDRYDITIQMLGVEASGPQYVWEKVPAEEGELVLYTDAQATIAALQAQLNEQSEKLKYHDLFKKWQCWRDPDELVDEYEKWQAAIQEHQSLKDQLTQRTAELEAANKLLYKKNCELGRFETIISDLQAELERVRADNKALDKWRADVTVSLQRPEGAFFVDVPQHIKDLVKERDDLRTLILALPKVEGEIRLIHADDGDWHVVDLYDAIFTDKSWAVSYAALLQHRQGMEGV